MGLDQLTLDNFAEDVLSMMDNLDIEIETATVLGPGFGTRVAHDVATFATKRTTAVILAVAGWHHEVPREADQALKDAFHP